MRFLTSLGLLKLSQLWLYKTIIMMSLAETLFWDIVFIWVERWYESVELLEGNVSSGGRLQYLK